MDGRVVTAFFTFLIPAVLIAVTVWKFASNPLSFLILVSTMVAGGLYLLTYRETFG
ncbi:MAG: hypothetical protein L3J95_00940 [Thermoplasmata archaeon]|nr:hypothetical protein [Thermoplasmata archaeon]MCI4358983.1 hypothetical protein [Thermoplasmata archaeon]